ncbi:translation factor [Auriculariales sp. MPI-PUGE-AT-0066]|nr:translation factor [Auriculariales sp. MPI-PUGE-AT-0066]
MTATTARVLACRPASIVFDAQDRAHISDEETRNAVEDGARLIRDGHCVAFPTETVYGLGANALEPSAVRKIFETKGRPSDNPLIVHVSSRDMLSSLLPPNYRISDHYETLIQAFWPGPLTLLFPAAPDIVPSVVTAGHPTVGVRMPAHPVARGLISLANLPIAAPSANSSGKPSPTRAGHVANDLGSRVPLVLDGGACDVGVESTVLDGLQSDGVLRILRPGGVSVECIQEALGPGGPRVLVHRRDFVDKTIEHAPTTPGMKYTHYSPSVPVVLLQTDNNVAHLQQESEPETMHVILSSLLPLASTRSTVGIMSLSDSNLRSSLPTVVNWVQFDIGPRAEPSIMARRLFDGLLTLEAKGVELIFVETISEDHEGLAIMNRLSKAASETRRVAM